MNVSRTQSRWLAAWFVVLGAAAAWLGFSTGTARAEIVANSVSDWVSPGSQGANGWYYGRFNKTDDDNLFADGYNATPGGIDDFLPFETSGAFPRFGFLGTQWDYIAADGINSQNPPWTEVSQTGVHPDSFNQPGGERWAMRRYVVQPDDVATSNSLAVLWRMRKSNLGGSGVTGKVFHNGVELDTKAIAGNDGVGVARSIYVPAVQAGDFLDLAYTPVGPTGDVFDGADGGNTSMKIRNNSAAFTPYSAPPVPVLAGFTQTYANSVTEFSGNQGQNNWRYGYFNKTEDDALFGDGYQDYDFTEFPTSGPNPRFGFLNGAWDYIGGGGGAEDPPWTNIDANGGHPNGTNNAAFGGVHWIVRRWESEAAGMVRITGTLADANTGCGDGTTGRIFVDGTQVFSRTADAAMGNGPYSVDVAVGVGSYVDFVVDNGPGGEDPCDATTFTGIVADPPPPVIYNRANSQTGFSGVQGQNGWRYGYWNRTADEAADDGDGVYAPSEFVEFGSGPNHGFSGGIWDWTNNGNPPWTELTADGGHPNGTNHTPGEPEDDDAHWAVRRWESDVNGIVNLAGTINKGSASGDGIVAHVYVDGAEVFTRRHTSTTAFNYSLYVDVHVGSTIDFVIDPSLFFDDDGADGSTFTANITSAVPEPSSVVLCAMGIVVAIGAAARRRRMANAE